MGNRKLIQLTGLFLLCAGTARGQAPALATEPDRVVFRYRQETGVSPKQMCVSVFTPAGPQAATASLTTDRGWAVLPFSSPSIRTPVNVCVQARPQGLNAGTYQGQLKITAAGSSVLIPVTMIVDATPAPRLLVAPREINVAVGRGAGATRRSFTLMNTGGGSLSAPVSPSSATWLSTQGGSAPLASGEWDLVRLLVDPSRLVPGAYSVHLVAQGPDRLEPVNVNLYVAEGGTALLPSQTGLEFTTVAGGPPPEAQVLGVVSSGPANSALALDAQPTWLRAANAGDGLVSVSVNSSSLAAGRYAGQLRLTGDTAANAPQYVAVGLTVLPAGPLPAGSLPAAGLWLSPAQPERTVLLNGAPDRSLDYTVLTGTDEGPIWLVTTPSSGTIPAGGTLTLTIRATLGDLPPGGYRGTVRIGLADGSVRSIPVVLQSACQQNNGPGIGFLSPLQGFHATAGQAVPIRVAALACDGTPLTDGDVAVLAGDRAVEMFRDSAGVWAGTWIPSEANPSMTLTAVAAGATWVDGQVSAAAPDADPTVTAAASAASQAAGAPVAAGSWMTIYGDALASDSIVAPNSPYPTSLGDVEVRFGDTLAPLYYVSPKQINLIVPRGLSTSTLHSLVVRRRGVPAVPARVGVADAAPALFTTNQQGTGQAAARIAGSAVIPQAGSPARRGDYIELYCTGLGPVSNPPADGAEASSTLLSSALLPVSLSLGGRSVPASFAGLVPGQVALYQVNFRIPLDGPIGEAVSVSLAVKGLTSNTATIAIQ